MNTYFKVFYIKFFKITKINVSEKDFLTLNLSEIKSKIVKSNFIALLYSKVKCVKYKSNRC